MILVIGPVRGRCKNEMAVVSDNLRRVHPSIVEDVDYVEKQWIADMEICRVRSLGGGCIPYIYTPNYER